MTDEELFSKTREQGGIDEYEKKITQKAIMYATIISVVMSLVIILLRFFIEKEFDFGIISLLFVFAGFPDLYEGIRNKSKKNTIGGAVMLFLSAVSFILCICEVLV